jgi:hypothetical protein
MPIIAQQNPNAHLWEMVILAIVYVVLEVVSIVVFKESFILHTISLLLSFRRHIVKEILSEEWPKIICGYLVSVPIIFSIITTVFCLKDVFITLNPFSMIIAGCFLVIFFVFISIFLYWMNIRRIVPWLSTARKMQDADIDIS